MRKPVTLLSLSLTSARTPRQPTNSFKPHSVHCEASGEPRKISVTATASAGRNDRTVPLACSRLVSAAMHWVPLPEDLRVRPAHVLGIQRQRVRKPALC